MTLILAARTASGVIMLGDSCAANDAGEFGLVRQAKVFRLGDLLLGYTTSFRMGQLLQYRLSLPDRIQNQDLMSWLCGPFADAVREMFSGHGFGDGKNSNGGFFLIVAEQRLFVMQTDFSVLEYSRAVLAVGSGDVAATAALLALTSDGQEITPDLLVRSARTTSLINTFVKPPWHVISSSTDQTLVLDG